MLIARYKGKLAGHQEHYILLSLFRGKKCFSYWRNYTHRYDIRWSLVAFFLGIRLYYAWGGPAGPSRPCEGQAILGKLIAMFDHS